MHVFNVHNNNIKIPSAPGSQSIIKYFPYVIFGFFYINFNLLFKVNNDSITNGNFIDS